MFDYTVKTDQSVEAVVEKLKATLKDESFGVLWDFDLSDTLKEKGEAIDGDYRILEVCNPKEAKKVITAHREGGYFLPCKLAVFTKDGATHVGMPKPTKLIELIEDESLQSIALDVETRLTRAIDNSI
ncbi:MULTISPECIES: DUF302 domain-containing protein [unclassified Exiguobacterium]|uniref:DUF302 domain-containing protein n=1 Tax=unclassified Exiguobacterium TaxID=2644629 RepID=UPI00103FDA09|nr:MULTISPECIES: DUF302 domain-containing protein [unclassified Exiguobacterium]TCI47466.1 DUF302 domain-containing protein [Exiguobacterium sp. SH5S32]TCI54350.1 DUF302 domain-containing protein [Exiguobacterium sp. SH1S4]TCI74143.1 DUF302 domain-containing protein [Exiguobacterium sp. SH1S1]TCI80441.1 DUF302 domain-containing protein [Exiguobacterium sp. SH0S1]